MITALPSAELAATPMTRNPAAPASAADGAPAPSFARLLDRAATADAPSQAGAAEASPADAPAANDTAAQAPRKAMPRSGLRLAARSDAATPAPAVSTPTDGVITQAAVAQPGPPGRATRDESPASEPQTSTPSPTATTLASGVPGEPRVEWSAAALRDASVNAEATLATAPADSHRAAGVARAAAADRGARADTAAAVDAALANPNSAAAAAATARWAEAASAHGLADHTVGQAADPAADRGTAMKALSEAAPAAAAALAGAALTLAATPAAAAEATLSAAPGSAPFASQLGAQITTFARNGALHAQLHLNPADMGPVTVQIALDGQHAQVHLAAEHALTRQALEQAMPQLASSLREAGLMLSGGGVFEQPRQGRDAGGADADRGGGGRRSGTSNTDAALDATGASAAPGVGAARRRGVVDLVA